MDKPETHRPIIHQETGSLLTLPPKEPGQVGGRGGRAAAQTDVSWILLAPAIKRSMHPQNRYTSSSIDMWALVIARARIVPWLRHDNDHDYDRWGHGAGFGLVLAPRRGAMSRRSEKMGRHGFLAEVADHGPLRQTPLCRTVFEICLTTNIVCVCVTKPASCAPWFLIVVFNIVIIITPPFCFFLPGVLLAQPRCKDGPVSSSLPLLGDTVCIQWLIFLASSCPSSSSSAVQAVLPSELCPHDSDVPVEETRPLFSPLATIRGQNCKLPGRWFVEGPMPARQVRSDPVDDAV